MSKRLTIKEKTGKFREYKKQLWGEIELLANELPNTIALIKENRARNYEIERSGALIEEKAIQATLMEWVIGILEDNRSK